MNTDEDFDQMVKDLQRRIDQEEELIYSKIVIREYKNPDKFGTLQNPDAVGEITGSCGDTMKISIKVSDDKITTARFWTDGCGATVAS